MGFLWGRGLGVGSFQGYAIQQGARYRLGKVVEGVEVKHERVSPYYYSEGAPFIFRGQQKIEGLVRYRVWRGWRGRVGGYYRRDNVSERRVQTTVVAGGLYWAGDRAGTVGISRGVSVCAALWGREDRTASGSGRR